MEEKYKPICPYIEQGCKGAENPIVYEQFCKRGGSICPISAERKGEKRPSDTEYRDELLKLDDLTLLRGVAV